MTTYKDGAGQVSKYPPLKLSPRELAADFGEFIRTLPKKILDFILLSVFAGVFIGVFVFPFIWFSNTSTGSVNAIAGEITEDVCPLGSWIKPASVVIGDPLLYRQPGVFGGFSEEAIPRREIKSIKITSGWFWDGVILERERFRSIKFYFLKKKNDNKALTAYELLIQ